jgi:hypothetical protein
MEVHTYSDGSQVVGSPPFPDKSPKELEVIEKARIAAMTIPPGMKTSGEPAPSPGAGITEEEFKAKTEQQLRSDIEQGKDPHTINPTTSSDKPELAGTDGTVELGKQPEDITAEDLSRIASGIKPTGENVTEEQVEAAAAQVARETKGPLLTGDEAKQADEARKAAKK